MDDTTKNDDIMTKAGLIARTRKATVAGAIALAGADGVVTGGEILPIAVTGVTLAVAAWFAVWATPNES